MLGEKKQTICLNMIVKNEAHLIVDSLSKLTKKVSFDYWVISDTGSTDGTQELIKSFFHQLGIPGELIEHEWQDFGYNRSKALECAYGKTDYLFVFDADDELCGPFTMPFLNADGYKLNFGDENGISYSRVQIVNNRKKWCYKGVLHEYIECLDPMCKYANLDGVYYIISGKRGARSLDPEKYYKDALVLERAHAKALVEKDDLYIRYAFYCANSYKDCDRAEDAIKWYKITLSQTNWAQEKYIACLRIFENSMKLNKKEEALYYLVESFKYDNTRVECIYHLVKHYCTEKMPEIAKMYYSMVKTWYETKFLSTIDFSNFLFIVPTIYNFYLPYYMIIIYAQLNLFTEGLIHFRIVFNKKNVECGEWVVNNLLHNFNLYIPTLMTSQTDKIGFLKELLEFIECAKEKNVVIKPEYIEVINSLIKEMRPIITKMPMSISADIKSSRKDIQVFLSITTCKRLDLFKQTMNSILNTWSDLNKVNYFFCVDDLSNKSDREYMQNTYPFIKFYMKEEAEKGHRSSMNIIWKTLKKLKPKYWIHLEDDWFFFKRDNYVSKGIRLLEQYESTGVHQILFNRNYAETYGNGDGWDIRGGQLIAPGVLKHIQSNNIAGPNCGYWPHYSFRPSIVSVNTILNLGNFDSPNNFFERDYANRYVEHGFQSAFFNAVSCMHIGKLTSDKTGTNAYTLNNATQFNSTTTTPPKTDTPIKIINLARRIDRKEKMNALFKRHRISNYDFVEAVDGSSLQLTYDVYMLFKGNDFGNRKGYIGCAMSHYALWLQLVKSNDSKYIIFEDDIQIEPEFADRLKKVQNEITDKTDILYLGLSTYDQNDPMKRATIENTLSSPLNRTSYIGGFFGYIITRKGAATLLEYISNNGIRHGIDFLPKIIPTLNCIVAQPNLVFSDVVYADSVNKDSNIQLDISAFEFDVVTKSKDDWEFVSGKDIIGNDLFHAGYKRHDEYFERAYFTPSCVAFNTLGFFKHTMGDLTTSPYFKSSDGVYVKKNASKKIRVRMTGNYWTSRQLCEEWNNLTKGNYTWNNIQFTWETNNIDYYVIINKPCNDDYFDPARTIIFHMEPWCYNPSHNWGVKTWGEWAQPDESKFLQVRSHRNYYNNGFWQLKSTYTDLKNMTHIPKYDHSIVSTICSSKYFDEGHIKRIDFLKFLEKKDDSVVSFHYYNHDNVFQFKNYMGGVTPNIDKEVGIMKYKYYFMCENNAEHNFITEKLWEPILCHCLCFYWGCPNVSEYIDPRAFVQLDMDDFEKSFQIMKTAISENWWEQRLPYIVEEKKKILEYYAFCPTVERIIQSIRK